MTMITLTQNEQPVSSGFRVDVSRGERVGRVSSEWFSRPDDERYLGLTDLYDAVRRRAERAQTRTVESRAVRVEASRDSAERLALIVPGRDEPVAPTHWSFGQLCTLVGAPIILYAAVFSAISRDQSATRFAVTPRRTGLAQAKGQPDSARISSKGLVNIAIWLQSHTHLLDDCLFTGCHRRRSRRGRQGQDADAIQARSSWCASEPALPQSLILQTSEGHVTDLTTVSCCGSKSASRTEFGSVARWRNGSSTGAGVSCHSRPALSLRSFDGRPTTSARSCRVSIFCAPRRLDSAIQRCLGSRPAVTFCCG
jgi:hypothetical protein